MRLLRAEDSAQRLTARQPSQLLHRGVSVSGQRAHAAAILLLLATGATSAAAAEASSGSPAAPPVRRVLLLPLQAVGVDPELLRSIPLVLDTEFGKYKGYDAASARDIRRIEQAEKLKQAGGCGPGDPCFSDISTRIDADLILSGSVGMVGTAYVVTLSLTDSKGTAGPRRASESVRQPEELSGAAADCLRKILGPPGPASVYRLPKDGPLSFAVFDLSPTGISEQTARSLTQVLTTEVKGVDGASVIGRADIAALVTLGGLKQQSGMDDGTMAALGGVLKVERLVSGDVGRLGPLYVVNLRLINVRTGMVENRVTESFEGEEEQLLPATRKAGRDLLGVVSEGVGKLTVACNQAKAETVVDDASPVPLPTQIEKLSPTRHSVRVTAPGFYDWRGDVYVSPSETSAVWAQLTARPQQWYQKWWVWTAAGGVLAGGITAMLLIQGPRTGHLGVTVSPPPTTGAAR